MSHLKPPTGKQCPRALGQPDTGKSYGDELDAEGTEVRGGGPGKGGGASGWQEL